jgi:hypothetical protein
MNQRNQNQRGYSPYGQENSRSAERRHYDEGRGQPRTPGQYGNNQQRHSPYGRGQQQQYQQQRQQPRGMSPSAYGRNQGYPQQGYSQQGYAQQGYPQQGYPQQRYPQSGHQPHSPQSGYSHPASHIPLYTPSTPQPGQMGFLQQPYGSMQAQHSINTNLQQ